MAQQFINTGSKANDRTGDPIRDAFIKINSNFTELYPTVPDLPENLIMATSHVDFDATVVEGGYQAFRLASRFDTSPASDVWNITTIFNANVWVVPVDGVLTKIIYQHYGNTDSSFAIIKNPTFGGVVQDSSWDFVTTSTTLGARTKHLLEPNLSVSMGDFLGFGILSLTSTVRLENTTMYAYIEFT